MNKHDFCPGCAPNAPRSGCIDSLKRLGIIKICWECWSECNLSCSFCFRTRGVPLNTDKAKRLLEALSTGGVSIIAFAGGDPSIRPDIVELIHYAHGLDLKVEVLTNAHSIKKNFLEALEKVEFVGISLDGPDAATHDTFRNKQNNFNRAIVLLQELKKKDIPVVVRSIVTKPNYRMISQMIPLLEEFPNVVRWSLMEFSPIEEGFINRKRFELDKMIFDEVASEIEQLYKGPGNLDIYRNTSKTGTYMLITPSGNVFSTVQSAVNGIHPIIGSIVGDHLNTLAEMLPFSKKNHMQRYEELYINYRRNKENMTEYRNEYFI